MNLDVSSQGEWEGEVIYLLNASAGLSLGPQAAVLLSAGEPGMWMNPDAASSSFQVQQTFRNSSHQFHRKKNPHNVSFHAFVVEMSLFLSYINAAVKAVCPPLVSLSNPSQLWGSREYFCMCGLGSQVGSGGAFLTGSRAGFPIGREGGFGFSFCISRGNNLCAGKYRNVNIVVGEGWKGRLIYNLHSQNHTGRWYRIIS